MYGYNPEDSKMHILNYYIPLGKRNIFPQRSEFKPPSFDHFLEFAKDTFIVQRPNLYSRNFLAFTTEAFPLLTVNDYNLIFVWVKQAWFLYINFIVKVL